ncbi:MAG: hypothetical protein HYZ75_19395 [Elusimicrobia bacterium]|nr:hypothetical protein [Elusimicrobiota bacterium]
MGKLLALLLVVTWPAAAWAVGPVGYLDYIDEEGVAVGWTLDRDESEKSIGVHFYREGAAGVAAGVADQRRRDVNQLLGVPGDHGFRFAIPSALRDGRTHYLYSYGIDSEGAGADNRHLEGSPQAFTFGPTPTDFRQWADQSGPGAPGHAYAPAIVNENGRYHVFYCANGDVPGVWDMIRYVHSTDGRTWSAPVVKLRAKAKNARDMAACDPSVVFFKGHYYMYYSSAYEEPAPGSFQTVVQVARAASIDGTYLTYTDRGTWELNPDDPKIIIRPLVAGGRPPAYGAGQQSVVVKGGRLLMWYTDDSVQRGVPRIYMLESSDPVRWSPSASRATDLRTLSSVDVKYEAAGAGRYVMVAIDGQHAADARLLAGYSRDGLTWGTLRELMGAARLADWVHNPGVGGDKLGRLLAGVDLVAFGAPDQLASADASWGRWDLYGTFVDVNPVTGQAAAVLPGAPASKAAPQSAPAAPTVVAASTLRPQAAAPTTVSSAYTFEPGGFAKPTAAAPRRLGASDIRRSAVTPSAIGGRFR